jgi:hypothetical protein
MMDWWWLSFVDADSPDEDYFQGVVIIQGKNVVEACLNASLLGINPGGEVKALKIPKDEPLPPEEFRMRLLNKQEATELARAIDEGEL